MRRVVIYSKQHPLLVFFVLTYLISWLPHLVGGGNFAFGPLIAASVAALMSGGRDALHRWWRYVARWRGGLHWYMLALLVPFAINGAAAGLAVLLGASLPPAERIASWPDLLVNLLVYLVAFGPLGEEPGWRGFALPRLLLNRSPLAQTLLLAAFVALWHLPLVASGQQPAVMLVALAAAQVLYSWLAHRSGVPVLIVMLAHAAQGGLGGAFFGPMFAGADAVLETNLLAALYCIVASVIVLFTGRQLGQGSHEPSGVMAQPNVASVW